MFLLEQPYKKLDLPWPMIVIDNVLPIDVANKMENEFPVAGGKLKNPESLNGVFKDFYRVNYVIEHDKIIQTLDQIFNERYERNVKLNHIAFRDYVDHEMRIARDWHTDLLDKKYHMMLYLGQKPGGYFEARNSQGITASFPYTHNRLICWRNTPDTEHRWFSVKGSRKTIGIGACYVDKRNQY